MKIYIYILHSGGGGKAWQVGGYGEMGWERALFVAVGGDGDRNWGGGEGGGWRMVVIGGRGRDIQRS